MSGQTLYSTTYLEKVNDIGKELGVDAESTVQIRSRQSSESLSEL
jgi:hypothetical protein